MEFKLYDSELRIMEVLWENGNTTAKHIAEILKEQVGWSKTTTYTVIKKCIDKGIISHYYPVFKPSGVDSDFLLRRLNNGLKKQLSIVSEGTGQHVLSLKKFKNIETSFPNIREQQKIGKFFKQLDFFIALHQRKPKCTFKLPNLT